MPYVKSWKLLNEFLFIQFEPLSLDDPRDHIPRLYDDPSVNQQLGIKRAAGSYDHDDIPVSVADHHADAFRSFVSVAVNSPAQVLSTASTGRCL